MNSQSYDVDNRYTQTKDAYDNNAGKTFLRRYTERSKMSRYPDIETERRGDDRIINPALGGTVPVGALGLGQKISNTDSRGSYKNPFRASQGEPKKYTTVKQSEADDNMISDKEYADAYIRSTYTNL